MSELIPNVDQWVPQVTKPTDGDPRDAASVDIALEALADRTFHLYQHGFRDSTAAAVPPHVNAGAYYLSGTLVLAGASTITFSGPTARLYEDIPITSPPTRNPESWWAFGEQELTTPRAAFKQRYSPLAPVAPWLTWLVPISRVGITTVTAVRIRIDPADGAHGGNLPDEQPILALWKYTATNGLMTAITSLQDNQPSAAAYEDPHDLEILLAYSLWGPDDALLIGLRGEEGNNAVSAGTYGQGALVVYQPRIDYTRTQLG